MTKNRQLSPRQTEIIRALLRGESDKEVAGKIGLSLHTVRNHIRAILERLRARNRVHAAAKFLNR